MINRADTIADDESMDSNREHQAALQVQREGLRALLRDNMREEIHDKIRNLFGVKGMRLVTRGLKEAFTREEEIYFDSIVASLSSDDMMKLKLKYPKELSTNDVEFKTTPPFKAAVKFNSERFRNCNAKEIKRIIRKNFADGNTLKSIGIELDPLTVYAPADENKVIDAIAEAIDKRLSAWETMRGTLAGDTNELSVQMALSFAARLSEDELHKALHPDEKEHKDLDELKGKSSLLKTITKFATLSGVPAGSLSYHDAEAELDDIKTDLNTLNTGGGTSVSAILGGQPIPGYADKDGQQGYKEILAREMRDMKELVKKYAEIEAQLKAMYKSADKVKLLAKMPKSFTDLVDASGVKKKLIGDSLQFSDLGSEWQKACDLKEGGYDSEIAEASVEHETHTLTGAEAILAISKAYMKKRAKDGKMVKLSEGEMQNVANMLLTRNRIDKDMMVGVHDAVRDILEGDMNLREAGAASSLGLFFKNLLYGQEVTYIQHLQEASKVREPLEKEKDYSKLVVYYFALRDSFLENGHLRNGKKFSVFAEGKLQAAAKALSRKEFTKSAMTAFQEHAPKPKAADHAHDKKDGAHADAHADEAPVASDFLLDPRTSAVQLLTAKVTDLSQEYQDRIKRAMEDAAEGTGWKRRLLGRTAKTAVTATVGAGYEYMVKAPAELGLEVGKTALRPVSAVIDGTRSAISNVFTFMTAPTQFGTI